MAEILNGRLETHPRPAPRHAWSASNLGGKLTEPFNFGNGGPRGWRILDEPELHLGADVVVPDLAGWRRERLPDLPDTPWFELAPDWVCEVLSPSTARIDRAVKMPLYANADVGYLWLIDPDLMTLEAYELCQDKWLLLNTLSGEDAVSLPPFDAIAFPLSALWG